MPPRNRIGLPEDLIWDTGFPSGIYVPESAPYPGLPALVDEFIAENYPPPADVNDTPEYPRPAVPIPELDVPLPPELPGDVIDPEAPPPPPMTNAENYPYPIYNPPGPDTTAGGPALPGPLDPIPLPGLPSTPSDSRVPEPALPPALPGWSSGIPGFGWPASERTRPRGRKRRGSAAVGLPTWALGAVIPRVPPRIPLPRPAPEAMPPSSRPPDIEGEVIPGKRIKDPVTIWEDYGDIPGYGGPRRSFPPGGYSERGPFGTKRQGEVVIVGRRPKTPPITIGGVPVRLGKRKGKVVVVQNPSPLPVPRAPKAERPTPAPRPSIPKLEIPRPEIPKSTPTPSSSGSSSPVPKSSFPAPAPAPAPAGVPASAQRSGIGVAAATGLAGLLSSLLRGRARRSSQMLPRLNLATSTTPSTSTFTDPLTSLNSPTLSFAQPLAASGFGGANFTRTSLEQCRADDRERRKRKRDACRRFKTIHVPAHTRRVCED